MAFYFLLIGIGGASCYHISLATNYKNWPVDYRSVAVGRGGKKRMAISILWPYLYGNKGWNRMSQTHYGWYFSHIWCHIFFLFSSMKFESKEIVATFYQQISQEEKGHVLITKFKCQCGNTRTQNLKKGYGNLISHIKEQHTDWEKIMEAKRLNSSSKLTKFINKKAATIFGWMEWVIMANLPFSFVENDLTIKYTTLESICAKTFSKYLRLLALEVENKVRDELPDKIGIVIDGWSEGNRHYIAVFAAYEKDGNAKMVLLAIAPPFDEENFDADSHKAFIGDVLEMFNKRLHNLLFLVGDNAPVNKKLADLLQVPFIGCASHRFNLACKTYLEPFELSLMKINELMKTLGNIKQAGKLRKKTDLEPIKRNATRWSSTYEMLKRFFEIKEFIDDEDEQLACHLPSGLQLLSLQKLLQDLKQFEDITKELQKAAVSLSHVRAIFDEAIEQYNMLGKYLGHDAKIVHSPFFESGIVKLLEQDTDNLSYDEKVAMECFKISVNENDNNPGDKATGLSIVQRAAQKKRKVAKNEYVDLSYVPPTSNVVERLFSAARLVLTDYRKSMTPYTFECIMFLKINRDYWDIDLVATIVNK